MFDYLSSYVPDAVRAPEALAIGGKHSIDVEPRRRPTFQYSFNRRRVRHLKNPVYDWLRRRFVLFRLPIEPRTECFKFGLVQCKLRGPNTGFNASKAGADDDCKDRCDSVLALSR